MLVSRLLPSQPRCVHHERLFPCGVKNNELKPQAEMGFHNEVTTRRQYSPRECIVVLCI